MKSALAVALVLTLAVVFLARPAVAAENTENPEVAAVAKQGNQFACDLYALLAKESKGNLFFSPSSLHTCLAMAYAGAAGPTAEQMAKALHFELPPDKLSPSFAAFMNAINNPRTVGKGKDAVRTYQLVIANALWLQKGYPFKKEYIDLIKKDYGAGMEELDYGQPEPARKTINDWVAGKTQDKIKDLIPSDAIGPATRLILTNAIYFKSNWAENFSKKSTEAKPFHLTADKTANVPMMAITHRYGYFETDDFQALELPYTLHELSMIVLLPKKADGLDELGKTLTEKDLSGWLDKLESKLVVVSLPKFKFAGQFEVSKTLESLGMTDAFSPKTADFSGMTAAEKLFISKVIHKAYVAVDEEGTEAAAATAVMMVGAAYRREEEPPKVFNADHPFVFLIRHNATGAILFMGRVEDPSAKGE